MKITAIATTIISALLLGGVLTACNQASPPNSSPTSSATTASTTPQASSPSTGAPKDVSQANGETPEREQRRESRRKEIEAVLTPDQVKQLQAKLKGGEKLRSAIASLDLTADQKTKIQIIFEKSYNQTPNPSPAKSQ
jgi:hypothetical protein